MIFEMCEITGYEKFWIDDKKRKNEVKQNNTMRKNLPKTLEQLIFCKYTLVFGKCYQIY